MRSLSSRGSSLLSGKMDNSATACRCAGFILQGLLSASATDRLIDAVTRLVGIRKPGGLAALRVDTAVPNSQVVLFASSPGCCLYLDECAKTFASALDIRLTFSLPTAYSLRCNRSRVPTIGG